MKVRFKRNWFGPDSRRYRVPRDKYDPPRDVPDEYRDQLPSDCEIVVDVLDPDAEEGVQYEELAGDKTEQEDNASAAFKAQLQAEGERPHLVESSVEESGAARAAENAEADAIASRRDQPLGGRMKDRK